MTSSGGIIRGIESWPEYGLARELVRLGHEVTVISSSSVMKKHDAKHEETVEGIKVKRFNPVLPSSLFYMLRNDFDIIHMHHLGYLAPISSYAALRKRFSGIPSVFTVHGIYHDPYLVKNAEDPLSSRAGKMQASFPAAPWKLANWFVHLPFSADRITALTEWEKKELEGLGIEPGRIKVIPDGIELSKYSRPKNNYFRRKGGKLLFVGQPTDRKGWNYFLEAMPEVLAEFPDARAVFIGYRNSEELPEAGRKLDIEDSVDFLGFLPEEQKVSVFKSSDIFVFPTLYEGFGIVFLEAMASGLPIVTTDVAGNKEIVENGKNGILVREKSSSEIAAAIIKLLKNKGIRNRMASNNIKKAKKYSWKIVAREFVELYESVMV